MTTDFNQKGKKFAFVARKVDPPYYKLLSTESCALAKEIETEIASLEPNQPNSGIARAVLGCFERFRGCIFYISRLAEYEKEIRDKAPSSAKEGIGMRKVEALLDFESLLFHSRSALDRLAFFVAKQKHGQNCDKYNKLVNVLGCFSEKDTRASQLIEIITFAHSIFEGILVDGPSNKKSLRSDVIHKSTATERTSAYFTLYCVLPRKRIAFDAIVGNYPLLKTSQELGNGLTYVILNALSLYLGKGQILPFDKCCLRWESLMVDYREYLSESPDSKRFTIWNITPSGCILSPVSLDPKVLNKAF